MNSQLCPELRNVHVSSNLPGIVGCRHLPTSGTQYGSGFGSSGHSAGARVNRHSRHRSNGMRKLPVVIDAAWYDGIILIAHVGGGCSENESSMLKAAFLMFYNSKYAIQEICPVLYKGEHGGVTNAIDGQGQEDRSATVSLACIGSQANT